MNPLPGSFHHKDIQGCIIYFLISPHSAWSPSLYSISNQMWQKSFFSPSTATTNTNMTGWTQKSAGVGVEFSLRAQTKYPALLLQFKTGIWMQRRTFSPLSLIHFDSRWRSLAWLGICDCCQQELWMGRQAESRAHTHPHTRHKLRVSCSDFAPIRTLGFRLHWNKGIQLHTPHLLTHKSALCSGIKSSSLGLSMPAELKLKRQI